MLKLTAENPPLSESGINTHAMGKFPIGYGTTTGPAQLIDTA
jgi:hypothetical protein